MLATTGSYPDILVTMSASTSLYISNGGRVSCAKHGGNYLSSHLVNHPNALVIDTPLDNWIKADTDDLAMLADAGLGCEGC